MGKAATGVRIRKNDRNAPRFKGGKRCRVKGLPARKRPKLPGQEGYDKRKNPGEVNYSHIENKHKRREMAGFLYHEKKKGKTTQRRDKLAARERGEDVKDGWTRTIEGTREHDETIVPAEDDEVMADEGMDEFASYFDGSKKPKLLMTTQFRPSNKLLLFLKEMKFVLPNCFYYKRGKHGMKEIIEHAKGKDFTDLLVFTEKGGKPHSLYTVHLPGGPTAMWRLTSLKLGSEMKGGATLNVDHEPELIMNNFNTRIGHRAGRQLAALFPQKPNFRGRRVITFHNQRDFIFFRHYRYNFKKEGTKAILQEIGPRFTLKMRYMQHGTFDSKYGEYEWVWRPDSNVSRKKMAM